MGDWKLILNGNDGGTPSVDLETGELKKAGKTQRKNGVLSKRSSYSTCAKIPAKITTLAAAQPDNVKDLRSARC